MTFCVSKKSGELWSQVFLSSKSMKLKLGKFHFQNG